MSVLAHRIIFVVELTESCRLASHD